MVSIELTLTRESVLLKSFLDDEEFVLPKFGRRRRVPFSPPRMLLGRVSSLAFMRNLFIEDSLFSDDL